MIDRIKVRRDTAANWVAVNPVLAAGEPGIEIGTNNIKYGDGVTGWRALPYAVTDTGRENQFVMNFSGWPVAATSTSPDGANWTVAFGTTWNAGDYANIDIFDSAIGDGKSCYLVYNYNRNRDEIWFSNTAYQALSFIDQPSTYDGPNGENINWQKIQYVNNKWVAVGYYYNNSLDDYYYPYFAYSDDAVTWSRGDIDLYFVQNLINDERATGYQYENGIYFEDVASNGVGWLFYTRWDYAWVSHTNGSGCWFLNDLTATLDNTNYSNGMPGSRYGFYDGMGWVSWDNNKYEVYFNSNGNPLAGVWTTQTFASISIAAYGNPSYCIQYAVAGKINGNDAFVITSSDGRWFVTYNLGISWIGVVADPFTSVVSAVSFSNPVEINIDQSQTQWWNWGDGFGEKITITGAIGIDGNPLNGTYYAWPNGYDSPNYIYELYEDAEHTIPVNGSGWTGGYTNDSAVVTWTHGHYLQDSTYGNGSIVSVDNNSGRIYRTVDLQNWTHTLGQTGWIGPWGYQGMTYGEISTGGNVLKSKSTRIDGFVNTLSLADDFNVTTVGGSPIGDPQMGPPVDTYYGYINLATGDYGRWGMGGGSWYVNGTGIASYDWNAQYDSVEIFTFNNSFYFVDSDSNNNNSATLRIPPDGDIIDDNSNASYFKDIPQNSIGSQYTFVWTDRGKHIYNIGGGTYNNYVPTNASVSFPIGTAITIVTDSSTSINIIATTYTTTNIVVPGIGSNNAGFNLPIDSMATLLKVASDKWMLTGHGITALN